LKSFGSIVFLYINRLLKYNLSAVGYLVNEMNGGAGYLDSVGKSRLVNLESVKALAAEGGNKRGMNVDYSVCKA
jgi:hypothetical protein